MGTFASDPLIAARLLFWIFAAGVLLLPMRWSFFCFILASHMDITSLTFASATTVGFENTIRIAVLPILLLARTGFAPLRQFEWTLPTKLWVVLVAYAAVSGLWSGFALSAAKMVVYLTAYLLLYVTLSYGWSAGWIDIRIIRLTVWCAIALAIFQTFFLGNEWGGIEERFTSFTSAQYFAACMVSLLAILVFSSARRGFMHYATCVLIVAAILLTGSRYVFISTVLLLIVASLRTHGNAGSFRLHVRARKVLLLLSIVVALVAALVAYAPENRLDEVVMVASDEDSKFQEMGTFGWRLGIYEEIFERLEKRDVVQLFFGSGTSSGAALMLNRDSENYEPNSVDANRVLHSEYLRALYEWGILGLTIFMAFLCATIIAFKRKIAAEGGGNGLAFLGVLPSLLIGLAIENILAGAVSAAGVGILLALSFAGQPDPDYSVYAEQEDFEQSDTDFREYLAGDQTIPV
jgi:O-Antigen ligase